MALKKRQHGPEIGENDIGSAGKHHTVGKLLEKLDLVSATICGGNLTSHLNDLARLDRVDPSGSKLAREHCENTRPRADFRDDGSFANALSQRFGVSLHANAIRNHRAIGAQAVHADLSVHRGCVCRNVRNHSSGIACNSFTQFKNC